jgi:uncharacterized membrane protein YdjX (TVP38/TMEM64 family)
VTAPGGPADRPPGPVESSTDQRFGWRHVAAILIAGGITAGIVAFEDRIVGLSHLAYAGAFLAMLIGNATVILPVPGLIIIFVLGRTLSPLLVGLAAGPGAALGEMSGYLAGYGGSAVIDNFALYDRIRGWMERHGLLVIGVLATIPNPIFDMAGIVAGSMRIRWWKFLLAALIGKTIQGIAVAYAGALSLGWVEKLLTG